MKFCFWIFCRKFWNFLYCLCEFSVKVKLFQKLLKKKTKNLYFHTLWNKTCSNGAYFQLILELQNWRVKWQHANIKWKKQIGLFLWKKDGGFSFINQEKLKKKQWYLLFNFELKNTAAKNQTYLHYCAEYLYVWYCDF